MTLGALLMLASLGTSWAEETDDPCEKWGKIDAEDGIIGQIEGDSLTFVVTGQTCPGVEPENCEWFLDPSDGSRGILQDDNTGGSMEWLPPGTADSCPPMRATLIVECVDLDGEILTNYADLTVDDTNNHCDLMGGGCISPARQAGGVFLVMPLLWFAGRREES